MKSLKIIIFLILLVGVGYGIWHGVSASKCPDSDVDGLDDCAETDVYHTEMFNKDTDGDGYTDGEEVKNGYSPLYGDKIKMSEADSDRDGLFDSEEVTLKTNLNKADTDGDGVNDFVEHKNNSNPNDSKSTQPKESLKDKILNASF